MRERGREIVRAPGEMKVEGAPGFLFRRATGSSLAPRGVSKPVYPPGPDPHPVRERWNPQDNSRSALWRTGGPSL